VILQMNVVSLRERRGNERVVAKDEKACKRETRTRSIKEETGNKRVREGDYLVARPLVHVRCSSFAAEGTVGRNLGKSTVLEANLRWRKCCPF
jgi:hypothetical protein